jgi:hypothetical protein
MEQLIAAVLARNTIELRMISGRILNELKKRKAAGVPAQVAGTSVPPESTAPVGAAPTSEPEAVPAKPERPFGIRCVTSGKLLKRRYPDKSLAEAALPALVASTKMVYEAVAI